MKLASFFSAGVVLSALLLPRVVHAAPVVWAIDDGEKIKQDAPASTPLATGDGNPVWSPGQPIRLITTKNETVGFQIVVAADAQLTGVTVDLDSFTGDGGATIANAPGATDPTKFVGRSIERFVEHFFDIAKPTSGVVQGTTLGWADGSGPAAGKWTGKIPDALVPVEVAPAWSPYPMNIAPGTNGIVWIDVTVPKSQAPGLYKGTVVVKAGGATLASLPVELDVYDVTLPDRPVKTMVYYEPASLGSRLGADAQAAAENHLFRLFHRHRLSALHDAETAGDVTRQLSALDGSLYTAANGYEGPAEGMGDGIVSIGTYGKFGAPDAAGLATVEGIADALEAKNLFASSDVFVYASDEDCGPYGQQWKTLLAGSSKPAAKKVKVGWTCSSNPSKQPVDIPILFASFAKTDSSAARAAGKDPWIYNGQLPQTGTFMTDSPAISLRVNGWLAGMYDLGRWFYWESTFWYDGNRGGKGPYDPFVNAETFHNQFNQTGVGDGVLVYPGKQVDQFTTHSIGMNGVLASIRLKNWRRGIEDAGIYQLARAKDAAKAEAIAKGLLPAVLESTADGKQPSWGEAGKPFFDARKALLALLATGHGTDPSGGGDGGTSGGPGGTSGGAGGDGSATSSGCGCHDAGNAGTSTLALAPLALAGLVLARRRRRR